jgi:UDP-galactopyranose mutase
MKRIAIVGAGFSGSVIALELVKTGKYEVDVFEVRDHAAGNCHTARDSETSIMLHVYGPHIFHTNSDRVWSYIQQFEEIMPFTNRVKAITRGRVFSLPINLLTINQFFGKAFSPAEASVFLEKICEKSITKPKTLEEQALRFIGRDLYEAFFKDYTIKQWGMQPSELPASILKRLPVRFNYDDNYYESKFQGIPKNGYTKLVEKILDHRKITVYFKSKFCQNMAIAYDHTFFSGPIDSWFNYSEDQLSYRTLDFTAENHMGDYQGTAVINYCDAEVPWTRISEHKYFSPWESHEKTVIFKEYSRSCGEKDTPYYPIRAASEMEKIRRYIKLARGLKNITFVGRLGTYRYIDMDVTILESMNIVKKYLKADKNDDKMPVFSVNLNMT